jgi:hypothetical protein
MSEAISLERQKYWMETIGHDIRKCSMCGEYEYKVFLLPKNIEVPIVKWNIKCYKCGKDTSVIWTNDSEYDGHHISVSPYSFKELPLLLSQKHFAFKNVMKKTQGIEELGNTCVHCDAYQGDWLLKEDLLEIYSSESEGLLKIEKINVELSDEERFNYAYTKLHKKLMNHTVNKETNEKILVCNECWKKKKSSNC